MAGTRSEGSSEELKVPINGVGLPFFQKAPGTYSASPTDRFYQYDEYGNMTEKTTPTGTTIEIPADPVTNRLNMGNTYAYDAQGNQTRVGNEDYLFDRLGQMTSVNQEESKSQYYIYTADEERLLTMDWCLMRDGDTGQCVGVPPANPGWQDHWTFRLRGLSGELLTEYSVEGDINQAFTDPLWDPTRATIGWQWNGDWIYRGSDLFAKRERYGSGFGINHFHKNHLGSVLLVTGPNQEIIDSGNFFTPFGLEAGEPHGPDESTLRFTGHERDFHNGNGYTLDYMHARYYSPDRARFLSVDPVLGSPGDPMSWNRYSYVLNNPMKYTDPDGEAALLVTAGIGALIGGVAGAIGSTAAQLIENGGEISKVNFRDVRAATLGGVVSGGLAGLTLGLAPVAATGAVGVVSVSAGTNVVGGAVTRATDSSVDTKALDVKAVAEDFVVGAVGAAVEKTLAKPLAQVEKQIVSSRPSAAKGNYGASRSVKGHQAKAQAIKTRAEVLANVAGAKFSGTAVPVAKALKDE